ncbi:MAG: ribulose bisphosphate carboxylase small subunit [Cyanobacteria bacterium P01_H01_bin.119]
MTYYIAPRFLDTLAIHLTKNYLSLPQVRVPLILGVHGRKGEGKTFQCELVFERMGVEVVAISGGELESPDAGDPARLIRLRYREAAELVRVRGKMAVLIINDLDAGAGRFDRMTQYTVNTQLVNNTLMNIADNPTNVQLPGSYDDTPLQRIPIVVTGNDFATLYAPLVRDGRMSKFYWQPDRADRIGIVGGIFAPDGLRVDEVEQLVDRFPQQAIDFYSALRSRIYDEQIREFIHRVGVDQVARNVVNTTRPPQFQKPNFQLSHLMAVGQAMVAEQHRVRDGGLVREYNQALQETIPLQARSQDEFYRAYADQTGPDQAAPQVAQNPIHHNGGAFAGRTPPGATDPPADDAKASKGEAPQQRFKNKFSGAEGDAGDRASTKLDPEVASQVKLWLSQGHRIGIERVDRRRFRTNTWQSCTTVKTSDSTAAIATIGQCLADYPQDYVRLIGIDPTSKRRVVEQIIQRPSQ